MFEVCEGEKRVGRRVERVGKHDGMVVVVVGEVIMGVWGGACRIGGGVSGRKGFG